MADLILICSVCRQSRDGPFFQRRCRECGPVCVSCALTADIALLSSKLPAGELALDLSVEVLEGVHRRLAARVAELQAASSPQQEASEAERQDAEIRQEAPLGR